MKTDYMWNMYLAIIFWVVRVLITHSVETSEVIVNAEESAIDTIAEGDDSCHRSGARGTFEEGRNKKRPNSLVAVLCNKPI